MLRRGALAIPFLLWAVGTAAAAPNQPALALPLDCVPGESCWVSKFLDLDPGPEVRDYMCTGRANDGHTGVDIAVRDERAMDEGVAVVAAAPGVVKWTRDGVKDVSVRVAGPDAMDNRGCGNGVVVDLGSGWSAQYCHMRQGSIAVKQGDRVETGQKLGLVGMSGNTEYPHLHFLIRYQGKLVDPFLGIDGRPASSPDCGPGKSPLWSETALAALAYTPAAIYNAGFADGPPDQTNVRKGRYRDTELPATAPVLVFWSESFGLEAGDKLRMRLLAPDGKVLVDNTRKIESRKARWFQWVGKKRPSLGWPAGTYRGEVTITRGANGRNQSATAVRELVVRAPAGQAR